MQMPKEDIRERILSAAAGIMLKRGFLKTSTRAITKKAKVTKSNFYNYFSSKEQLFSTIVEPAEQAIDFINDKAFEQIYWNIFDREEDMVQYIELHSSIIFEMMMKYRTNLILISDCSKGTKYENFKADLIARMVDGHLTALKAKKNFRNADILLKVKFQLHLVAMNYVEGLLEIAKHSKNDKWLFDNIKLFTEYHIKGLAKYFL